MSSSMKDWLEDLRVAVTFPTRVPIPHSDGVVNVLRAMRAFPLVAAAIGLARGACSAGPVETGRAGARLRCPGTGASALLAGALHGDGLGDVADGFGGGRDQAAKLEIMRDSRLGTYGTLALLISFAAKLAALAAPPPASIIPGLIATHALARCLLPAMVSDVAAGTQRMGSAQRPGRPIRPRRSPLLRWGFVIALMCLPWGTGLRAILVTIVVASVMGWLARRQIGGHTGDVLGGTEQVSETLILVLLATLLTSS